MKLRTIALLSFLAAFLILLEQYLVYGEWFTISQILHHETLAVGFVIFGLGLVLGKRFRK